MDSQEGRAYNKQCLEEQDKRRAYLYTVITHIRPSLGEHTLRAHTSRAIADSYNKFKEKQKQKNLMRCDDLITKTSSAPSIICQSHKKAPASSPTRRSNPSYKQKQARNR